MEKDKINVLRKCIGKKYLVIENDSPNWIGEVTKVINHENLLLRSKDGEIFEASIFDLRNPYHEI